MDEVFASLGSPSTSSGYEAISTAAVLICAVLDVRPILNGPNLDEPTDENSPENMQAIADALVETGLPELD